MKSEGSCEDLDLARDLPTLPNDIVALRDRTGTRTTDLTSCLEFLAQFQPSSSEALRARPGPRGTPFSL